MHAEYLTALSCFDPLVDDPLPCVAVFVVVVVVSCATPDVAGLLPQPVAVKARLARTMRMRMRDMVDSFFEPGTIRALQK
jgi:hypothetical protein